MEDSHSLLNPWLFHLQKLALELKCPLCLDLLQRPVLLPCNHVFCNSCIQRLTQFGSECPVCQRQYVDREMRPAPYMENIVTVYKSLCSTSLSKIFHPVSSDVGRLPEQSPVLIKTNAKLKKEPVEIVAERNSTTRKSLSSLTADRTITRSGQVEELGQCGGGGLVFRSEDRLTQFQFPSHAGDGKHADIGIEEINMNQMEQLSPGSTHSLGEIDGNSSDPGSSRDVKRQKKSNSLYANRSKCGFCHSSDVTDGTGPMLHYANGKLVVGDVTPFSKVTHVHKICIDWTPRIYYEGDKIKNLEPELARAAKLKCSCGLKGAALGCYIKACRKTYHVPCAVKILDCRWDCEDFLLLCPIHKSFKFPRENFQSGTHASLETDPISKQTNSKQSNFWSTLPHGAKTWVFCGSDLSAEEKCYLVKFASGCSAVVSRCWKPNITHVITATDSNGACVRTLKVLMAILHGRWIVTMDWIKACVEANRPVDEEPFEVSLDNHGCRGGPKTGRLRASDNAPKLFHSLNFYFSGDFTPAYKNDLLNLVITAGGTVIESKEQLVTQNLDAQATLSTTLVVYNIDPVQRCALGDEDSIVLHGLEAAEDLAEEVVSQVIKHTWILESIAACELQPLPAVEGSCNGDVLMLPRQD